MGKKSGFSLIEIMVVVGIIGVMAAIAVPSYNNFRARALQKEGFTLLSTYYSAAQTTRVEFGHYPGNFVQTGFQPDGTIGYRLRADDNNDIGLGWNDDQCERTDRSCNCGGNCPSFKIWTEKPLGDTNRAGVAVTVPFAGACGVVPPRGVTDTTFSIRAVAWLGTGGDEDAYAMDQEKNLVMCQDGLN